MIDPTPLHRPRISRETRQLLLTVLLAVLALWVLGRVRYPERPAPVPALLTQLAPPVALDEIAAESTRVRSRLAGLLLPVQSSGQPVAALRTGAGTAVALMPDDAAGRVRSGRPADAAGAHAADARRGNVDVIASDNATGLVVMRVDVPGDIAPPALWAPRQMDEPRYLLTTVASADTVVLRPAFVGALRPVTTPAWSNPIWAVPPGGDLREGSLVFTVDAELAGLTVRYGDGIAIVPGATLLADAQRVRQLPARMPGFLGLEVQTMTAPLAAATGARYGVVVTWVDPDGPAAGKLAPGDAIEAADGRWLETREHWDVRVARLAAGDPIVLGARRHGEWRDVQLQAAPLPADLPLGLTLRRVPDAGSEIVRVDRSSAAAAAGLLPGDLITLAGTYNAPTPAQVRSAFEAAAGRTPVLIGVSRGTASRILTLHR